MFDRFTEGARKAICFARNEARTLRHAVVGTEHILLGLARERSGGAAVVLGRLDLDRESVRNEVRKLIPSGAPIPEGTLLSLTARGLEALAAAERAARPAWKPGTSGTRAYIGTEHVLIGLLSIAGCGAARVLDQLGRRDLACREVLRLLFAGKTPPTWSEWAKAPPRPPTIPVFGGKDPFGGADPFGGDDDELCVDFVDAEPAAPEDDLGAFLRAFTAKFEVEDDPVPALPAPLAALPFLPPVPPHGSLCPRGHGAMNQLLRDGIHVAVCPVCLGTYFPPGELETCVRLLGARLAGPGAADELGKLLWRLLDPG